MKVSTPWTRPLVLHKLRAVGVHLAISLVLVGIALALILLLWFPPPFFQTDGAAQGVRLILLVDLVLGPLLTFVVFNPAKSRRELFTDLGLIAAAQLAAYAGGLYSVHRVRIQAVAYHEGQFHTVNADTYRSQTIEPGGWEALAEPGGRTGAPYVVDVRAPQSEEESAGVLAFSLTSGVSEPQLHFLYRPFAPQFSARAAEGGYDYAALRAKAPAVAEAAKEWAREKAGVEPQALRYFPVQGIDGSAVLAFDLRGKWKGGFDGDLSIRER